MGLTGRLDPHVLQEELKDTYKVDVVSFSALPVNKHLEKDGWDGYCTKKKLEQVLENLRCENALLEAVMQVKCRLGNNLHVPKECGKMVRKPHVSATLPIDCIAHIISYTSPLDACRCHLFVVNSVPLQCAAAGMDTVWERCLPTDYDGNISHTNTFLSAKEKFYNLCDKPVFSDGCSMGSFIDRRTGKKCLAIWNSGYNSVSGRRWLSFNAVVGFESKLLSPKTVYVAYLVFNFRKFSYGCDVTTVELVHREGRGKRGLGHVLLEPPEDMDEVPRERPDGSMEMAMGEFFNDYGDDGARIRWSMRRAKGGHLIMSVLNMKAIEFRPKVV